MNKQTEEFLQELKQNPSVLGVVLFGSWARGNNREDSDVDLVVLLEKGYKRAVEEKDGQVFEIIYTTPSAAFEYWESHKDDCAGLWAVAKILYSKDGVVEELKEKVAKMLENGKTAMDPSQKDQTLFDKKDKLKYIKSIHSTDEATANLMLFNTTSELTEVFFDLQQEWGPAPKQRLAAIEQKNGDFGALLREFYSEKVGIERRWELLEQMITLVFDQP